MAYDNFESTPFDLNGDGHIDSSEASYIYENLYNEDNNQNDDSEDCLISATYGRRNCSSSSNNKALKLPTWELTVEP